MLLAMRALQEIPEGMVNLEWPEYLAMMLAVVGVAKNLALILKHIQSIVPSPRPNPAIDTLMFM